jgi:Flp pilus assembly protein TadB
MSTLDRWQARQQELDRGVDADLVRDNRRRYRLSLGLTVLGLLLLWLGVRLSHVLRVIVLGTGVVSLIVGLLMAEWAKWEWRFLRKPSPEAPRSIIKE